MVRRWPDQRLIQLPGPPSQHPRRTKTALIWEGEPEGDRVCMYLPMIPELPIAMLACARMGAIHSIVFGGFSAESLKDRILDAETKILITSDGSFRRGRTTPQKAIAEGREQLGHTTTLADPSVVE